MRRGGVGSHKNIDRSHGSSYFLGEEHLWMNEPHYPVHNGGIEPIEIKKAGTVCQANDYGLLGVKRDETQTNKTRFLRKVASTFNVQLSLSGCGVSLISSFDRKRNLMVMHRMAQQQIKKFSAYFNIPNRANYFNNSFLFRSP